MPKLCRTGRKISGVSGSCEIGSVAAMNGMSRGSHRMGLGAAFGALGGLLQGRIGLVDQFELLFRSLVAAIGVGVEALHQLLVARLDLGENRRRLEAEKPKRLLLGASRHPILPRRSFFLAPLAE